MWQVKSDKVCMLDLREFYLFIYFKWACLLSQASEYPELDFDVEMPPWNADTGSICTGTAMLKKSCHLLRRLSSIGELYSMLTVLSMLWQESENEVYRMRCICFWKDWNSFFFNLYTSLFGVQMEKAVWPLFHRPTLWALSPGLALWKPCPHTPYK